MRWTQRTGENADGRMDELEEDRKNRCWITLTLSCSKRIRLGRMRAGVGQPPEKSYVVLILFSPGNVFYFVWYIVIKIHVTSRQSHFDTAETILVLVFTDAVDLLLV